MISVEEARRRALADIRPLPAETVGLRETLGRVLAHDVTARRSQPPVDVSAMDGYAVRATDVANAPVTLKVVGEAPAGASVVGAVGPGEAVRIFTGGPMPDGADAIVIQENTEAGGGAVITVLEGALAGAFVRPSGLDFRDGDVLLKAGRVISARDVGLVAAMNVPWLSVRRRPRVAILATGNEIVLPGDPIAPGQIVSSNGLAIGAMVKACGGEPTDLGIAVDDVAAMRDAANAATGTDILVTTGGASVGDHDLVQQALGEVGLKVDFWRVAMRPGKPLIFGWWNGVPMLGLPGNPVSAMVCAIVFLRPALARLLDRRAGDEPASSALLGADLDANDERQDYLRASLSHDGNGELVATPFGRQDSSMFATMARADCLVIRPPHAVAAAAGERVSIVPLYAGMARI